MGAGAGIGSVVGGIGQGVVGLAAMRGAFNEKVPSRVPDRSYAGELAGTLEAIQGVYPDILALQAQYQPAATQNELSQIDAYNQFWQQQYPVVQQIQRKAEQDLALGNRMSMAQQRAVQQDVRAGQAARGFGYGPSDIYEEAMAASGYRDQLEQQRYQNALAAAGLNNPYLSFMGSQTPNLTNMVMANPYAQDVYSGNWNRAIDERLAAQNYNRAMKMGGVQTLGQSFSTAAGGASSFGGGGGFTMPTYSSGGAYPLRYNNPYTASYVGGVQSGALRNPWQ